MLKKAGLLTVGITAGLLAVAPIASAGEYGGDHDDKKNSHEDDHKDWDGDHEDDDHDWDDEDDDHEHDGGQHGTGNISCDNEGGDFEAAGSASELLGLAGGPIASGNTGNILSCNSFLNDNLNDNEINISGLGGAGNIVPTP